MELDTYISTAIGIVVSVVLALYGYRQTIGARKERVRAANSDIQKLVVKRVMLEDYNPSFRDVRRLTVGKAHSYNVDPGLMIDPDVLMDSVYSDVLESDHLSPERRRAILDKLTAQRRSDINEKMVRIAREFTSEMREKREPVFMFLVILAFGATVAGTLATFFVDLFSKGGIFWDDFFLWMIPGALLGFMGASAALTVLRARDRSIDSGVSSWSRASFSSAHESAIAQAIVAAAHRHGYSIQRPAEGDPVDFLLEFDEDAVAIEVKETSGVPSKRLVQAVNERVRRAADLAGASTSFVVIPDGADEGPNLANDPSIVWISLSAFLNKLERGDLRQSEDVEREPPTGQVH